MSEDNSILVTDLPEQLTDVVEAYLESSRKGGGKIKSFQYDQNSHSALVTFESSDGMFYLLTKN